MVKLIRGMTVSVGALFWLGLLGLFAATTVGLQPAIVFAAILALPSAVWCFIVGNRAYLPNFDESQPWF
jgi:hypothetical protein